MSHSPNVGPPATPNHSAARRAAITLALAGLLVLAGCGPQGRTQLASGTIAGQRWSVFAYRDNGVCMEVQADGQDASKVCDLADDGVWRTYVRSGLILMGWSPNTSVVRGVVSLRDGSSVEAEPVAAPKVADLRFLVWSLPLSAQLTEAHLLDSAGSVVGTWDLRGPGG